MARSNDTGPVDRRASSLRRLVQSAQTPTANMHRAHCPTNRYLATLDIGPELPVRCPFGVTYVVAELRALATDFTLRHLATSLELRTERIIPHE